MASIYNALEHDLFLNKTFNSLTIVEFVDRDAYLGHNVKCLCDCGNHKVVRLRDVVRGHTKSCGCASKFPPRDTTYTFEGCGDIHKNFFYRIQHGAKARKIDCDITIDYLWELFLLQDRKCALTKLPLTFAATAQGVLAEQTASLDRINSKKGYVAGNIQWVHKKINIMKMAFTQEEFIEFCNLVAEHSE